MLSGDRKRRLEQLMTDDGHHDDGERAEPVGAQKREIAGPSARSSDARQVGPAGRVHQHGEQQQQAEAGLHPEFADPQ